MARRYKPRLMTVGEARHVTTDTSHYDENSDGWDGTIFHAKQMANIAASRIHFRGADLEELREEALSGVMMQLAENPGSTIHDCINSGAVMAGKFADQQMQGKRRDGRNTGARFQKYWNERKIQIDNYGLDALALSQVWDALDEDEQRILTLAALHDTTAEAAQHAGLHTGTMTRKIRAARKKFNAIWHDWETPPKLVMGGRKRLKTHCVHGHLYSTENTRWEVDNRGNRSRKCKTCGRIKAQEMRARKKKTV